MRYSALSLLANAFTGHKHWPPAWRDAAPREAYEVVIIGGGGHGLSTAHYLAKEHGIANVAVIEKGWIGSGNVGRNTTIVRSNYLLPGNIPLYELSLKLWEGLEQDLNYNAMVSQRGVINLFHSDATRNAAVRRGNAMRLDGIDAELLDRAAVLKFAPELAASEPRRFDIVGGLLQPRGGTVRHDAVAWGYARAAAAHGVDIIEDCEVTDVRTAAGIAVGVETTRGYVKADRIVFAVAGHTGAIGRMLGVQLPIETHLLQAMVTEPIKPLIGSVHVYVHPHGEVYITQSDRGGVVMGGFLDGFPSYTREGQWYRLEDVVQSAVALLPQIAGLRLLRHWAGTNDMTMDGSFIIDRIRYDNVFLNGGWCYGGFKAIPASGAACATFVATGTAPDLIRAHGLSRFETGHLLDERGGGPFPVRQ